MRKILCKMKCHSVSPHPYTEGMVNVQLGAVYSPEQTGKEDDENAIFGKLTPFGHFQASMVASAAETLVPGKEYYLELYQAEEA